VLLKKAAMKKTRIFFVLKSYILPMPGAPQKTARLLDGSRAVKLYLFF